MKCSLPSLSAAQVQDETIEMFMFQLVQALKHQNYHDSALCRFLMKRALNNQRLGHKFFWSLRCEISSDLSNLNLVLILEARYIQHSHCSSSDIAGLCCNIIIVLLREHSYVIKNQFKASKAHF